MQPEETIRETIRKTYGNVAKQGNSQPLISGVSCCGTNSRERRLTEGCGCGSKELNPEFVSSQLGYSQQDMNNVPEGANLGLGCGNPKTIAGIKEGETVIDLGSGAGFDCFLAAREVGDKGKVIGVDMTPEMIARSRENLAKTDIGNVEFRLGEIEHLPVEDNVADLIISNCVINLSPAKQQVFNDAFRVLKTGGRIAVSDIVALKPLPEDVKNDLELVSACIGGAATIEGVRFMLENAGFGRIKITPEKVSQDLVDEWLPGSRAGEFVAPAYIEAVKL